MPRRGGSQPSVVTALSAATGGDLSRDLFWREVLGPAGAGDVLDVMFAIDGVCWGRRGSIVAHQGGAGCISLPS